METESPRSNITQALLQTVLQQYSLSLHGIHGLAHWARVLLNGRRLAQLTGARLEVVELFAIFHDSRRQNDGVDYQHGKKGAELAASLRGSLLNIDSQSFDMLYYACAYHTDGLTEADITIQTCWDSDRLDLWRAHIKPRPDRLCTAAATDPEVFSLAKEQSLPRQIPDLIAHEWRIDLFHHSDDG